MNFISSCIINLNSWSLVYLLPMLVQRVLLYCYLFLKRIWISSLLPTTIMKLDHQNSHRKFHFSQFDIEWAELLARRKEKMKGNARNTSTYNLSQCHLSYFFIFEKAVNYSVKRTELTSQNEKFSLCNLNDDI